MSLIPKACFFTGHRIIGTKKCSIIEGWLREEILDKINHRINVFITGGAVGFDTMAAEQVLFMKEDYPDIKLYLYLPCINHDCLWKKTERERFAAIKNNADKIYYVTNNEYTEGCMRKRNRAMVEAADCGIAYIKTNHSGAAQTMKMAQEKGIDVINIADKIKEYE